MGPAPPPLTLPGEVRRQINNGMAAGCSSGCLLWLGTLLLISSVPFLNVLMVKGGAVLGPVVSHGPPILLLGLVYFQTRTRSPWFARGWGYGIVLTIVLSLGAVVICRA